jgi:hypothetical protein
MRAIRLSVGAQPREAGAVQESVRR